MYIRATGNISPQNSFGHLPFPMTPIEYTGNRLACVEPDYKTFIDVKLIRRMSRIIRMGVATAIECLEEGGIAIPDAIITGTAYGCLEDTGIFLTKMVENNEELLTPTAFIQSTHNTIGAQIGLMLQSNNYNNAYVHRGFSFESALLDGMLLLEEKEANHVLVGAIDEITNISHSILTRMGLYKQGPISNMGIFKNNSKGTIGGEGSTFFLLANEPSATDYAKLEALLTFYKPGGIPEIEARIVNFLEEHAININDIDLLVTGKNGDAAADKIPGRLLQGIFKNTPAANFKHLCGEYPTATAFALWMAAKIIKSGTMPELLEYSGPKEKKIQRILIYNNYLDRYHTLLLVAAC